MVLTWFEHSESFLAELIVVNPPYFEFDVSDKWYLVSVKWRTDVLRWGGSLTLFLQVSVIETDLKNLTWDGGNGCKEKIKWIPVSKKKRRLVGCSTGLWPTIQNWVSSTGRKSCFWEEKKIINQRERERPNLTPNLKKPNLT